MNIDDLQLTEHPEGGRFREVHRSPTSLSLPDGRERSALTHIYFHLAEGEVSTFHRVEQEEVWNLYTGNLRLWLLNPASGQIDSVILSKEENNFCHVIPAGIWQAAEPLDGEALVGCSVAPGFDFADFTLMDEKDPLVGTIRKEGLERFRP